MEILPAELISEIKYFHQPIEIDIKEDYENVYFNIKYY